MGSATLQSGYTLYVEAYVESQNKAENYSTIRWRRYVKKTSSRWYRGQWQSNVERVWSNLGAIRETNGWYYDFLNNTIQLDATGTFRQNHDANGYARFNVASYVNIVQIGSATAYAGEQSAPRIPVKAGAPGKGVITNLKPTSLTLTWPVPSDNGGSAIDKYRIRYWSNKDATGTPVTIVTTDAKNALEITGLTPGKDYSFRIAAHNASSGDGYSAESPIATTFTPSGARVFLDGQWKLAIPYIRIDGVWKMGSPFIYKDAAWKRGS